MWASRDAQTSTRLALLCDLMDEAYPPRTDVCGLCFQPPGPLHDRCLACVGTEDSLEAAEIVSAQSGVCVICGRGGLTLRCECGVRAHVVCASKRPEHFKLEENTHFTCLRKVDEPELHTPIVWIRAGKWSKRFNSTGVVGSSYASLDSFKKMNDFNRPRVHMQRVEPKKRALKDVPVFYKRSSKRRKRITTPSDLNKALVVVEPKEDKKETEKKAKRLTLDDFPSLKSFYSK